MQTPNDKIFINTDKTAYNLFIQKKQQKRATETRIDRLESIIIELQSRVAILENQLKNESVKE